MEQQYPFKKIRTDETIKALKIGDIVFLDGKVISMRDQAHKRILKLSKEGKYIPLDFSNSAIYHCGPLVKREKGKWIVLSAGPTTSFRMEPFIKDLLKISGAKIVIGKGGMGSEAEEAMRENEAIYCEFTGGCGVLAAKSIEEVIDVKWLDLGIPEAVWTFRVRNFGPLIVTIDSRGSNLRKCLFKQARAPEIYS